LGASCVFAAACFFALADSALGGLPLRFGASVALVFFAVEALAVEVFDFGFGLVATAFFLLALTAGVFFKVVAFLEDFFVALAVVFFTAFLVAFLVVFFAVAAERVLAAAPFFAPAVFALALLLFLVEAALLERVLIDLLLEPVVLALFLALPFEAAVALLVLELDFFAPALEVDFFLTATIFF